MKHIQTMCFTGARIVLLILSSTTNKIFLDQKWKCRVERD